LVEHTIENRGVGGSNPPSGTIPFLSLARGGVRSGTAPLCSLFTKALDRDRWDAKHAGAEIVDFWGLPLGVVAALCF
jgi:hypothetical protein